MMRIIRYYNVTIHQLQQTEQTQGPIKIWYLSNLEFHIIKSTSIASIELYKIIQHLF